MVGTSGFCGHQVVAWFTYGSLLPAKYIKICFIVSRVVCFLAYASSLWFPRLIPGWNFQLLGVVACRLPAPRGQKLATARCDCRITLTASLDSFYVSSVIRSVFAGLVALSSFLGRAAHGGVQHSDRTPLGETCQMRRQVCFPT